MIDIYVYLVSYELTKRSLNNLTLFFKEVANEDSILKMESGTSHVELTKEEIKRGFVRIQSTVHDETTIVLQGIFKGILLDSERFEIVDDIGVPIRGTIHESLEDEELTEYNKEFTNEECKITILESITTFNENKRIRKYELLKIERL